MHWERCSRDPLKRSSAQRWRQSDVRRGSRLATTDVMGVRKRAELRAKRAQTPN